MYALVIESVLSGDLEIKTYKTMEGAKIAYKSNMDFYLDRPYYLVYRFEDGFKVSIKNISNEWQLWKIFSIKKVILEAVL